MELVRPFKALYPRAEHADSVIAPPYDVLSVQEARDLASGRPHSFLHISRPEIDLPSDTNPYDDQVYAKASENFQALLSSGCMQRDEHASYYIYRIETDEHTQTGIALTASVAAYRDGRIKKHEHTLPRKETDRVRQIDAINAQTGPVLMAHQNDATLHSIIAAETSRAPLFIASLGNGTRHSFWPISEAQTVAAITGAFNKLDALYIADGHHRSAAAERVAAARADAGNDAAQFFLAVSFSAEQLRILDYNRVVRDLNGLDAETFLKRLGDLGELRSSTQAVKPAAVGQLGIYIGSTWHHLKIDNALIEQSNPVTSLDVSLLTELILAPLLGISDLRNDSRIDFVGGSRGLQGLQSRVDSGEMAVAFSMFPTPIESLIAIADAGEVMPPKSTWFEPKLADGVVSHVLD